MTLEVLYLRQDQCTTLCSQIMNYEWYHVYSILSQLWQKDSHLSLFVIIFLGT